jgi:hypothetical protein
MSNIVKIEKYLTELCDLSPYVNVVPTDDPQWWVMTKYCDDTCHHMVHAFHSQRAKHLIEVPPFHNSVLGKIIT